MVQVENPGHDSNDIVVGQNPRFFKLYPTGYLVIELSRVDVDHRLKHQIVQGVFALRNQRIPLLVRVKLPLSEKVVLKRLIRNDRHQVRYLALQRRIAERLLLFLLLVRRVHANLLKSETDLIGLCCQIDDYRLGLNVYIKYYAAHALGIRLV